MNLGAEELIFIEKSGAHFSGLKQKTWLPFSQALAKYFVFLLQLFLFYMWSCKIDVCPGAIDQAD